MSAQECSNDVQMPEKPPEEQELEKEQTAANSSPLVISDKAAPKGEEAMDIKLSSESKFVATSTGSTSLSVGSAAAESHAENGMMTTAVQHQDGSSAPPGKSAFGR